jgi:hypothetical protein
MGVHRIFTVPSFRGCGIIRSLLDEACKHTIYGYKVRTHVEVADETIILRVIADLSVDLCVTLRCAREDSVIR